MNNYFNHSGGAEGADMEWDKIGRELGFMNHKHYRPSDVAGATILLRDMIDEDVYKAAKSLGRPTSEFPGKNLVRRNWFQAKAATAVYAISRIVGPGEIDKGFVNKTGKQIISGGTAWACEMAIQMGKPVYLFDMNTNRWHTWYGDRFEEVPIPSLTHQYAGIGSRNLNEDAKQAIRDVYNKTLKYEQAILQANNGDPGQQQ